MEYLAYSQIQENQQKTLRLLWPGLVAVMLETLVGLLILIALNLSDLESRLLSSLSTDASLNPLISLHTLLNKLLADFSAYPWASQLTLFVLWAVVGMLVYLLAFRIVSLFSATATSVRTSILYVRTDHLHGFFKWLGTLHDVLLKILLITASTVLLASGIFLLFTYANLQFHIGFSASDLVDRLAVAWGILSAFIGIRFVMLSFCLLSPPFRRYYLR